MSAASFSSRVSRGRFGEADRGGWGLRVERGPDWLFVRLEAATPETVPAARADLAESIWAMLQEHRAHRLVLELDGVEAVADRLVDVITKLGGRLREDGGLLRVCGLSQPNASRLRSCRGIEDVPLFDSRSDAIGARARGLDIAADGRSGS